MVLIEILLPLNDKSAMPFLTSLFRGLQQQLAEKFGGVTTYMRSPAHGLWDDGSGISHQMKWYCSRSWLRRWTPPSGKP